MSEPYFSGSSTISFQTRQLRSSSGIGCPRVAGLGDWNSARRPLISFAQARAEMRAAPLPLRVVKYALTQASHSGSAMRRIAVFLFCCSSYSISPHGMLQ